MAEAGPRTISGSPVVFVVVAVAGGSRSAVSACTVISQSAGWPGWA